MLITYYKRKQLVFDAVLLAYLLAEKKQKFMFLLKIIKKIIFNSVRSSTAQYNT